MNWQPIKTAPKDKWILVLSANQWIEDVKMVAMCKWVEDDRAFLDCQSWPQFDATHWMPLPPEPTE